MAIDVTIIGFLVTGIVAIIVAVIQSWPNRGARARSDVDRATSERDKATERADRLAAELEDSRRDERIAQEEMSRLRRRLHDAGIDPAG